MEEIQTPENQVNPLDTANSAVPVSEQTDLLRNIVESETKSPDERLLEDVPELDNSLLEEVEAPKSPLLFLLKSFFAVLSIGSIVSVVFFTSQLTSALDFVTSPLGLTNASGELGKSNNQVTALQTELNSYRFLQIKATLDKISFYGDGYLQNFAILGSQTSSSSAKEDAELELSRLRGEISDAWNTAKDLYLVGVSAPLIEKEIGSDSNALNSFFQQKLVENLSKKSAELAGSDDPQAKIEQKNYNQTIQLVANQQLKDLIIQTDFDALNDQQLNDLIQKINESVVNDMSTIQSIKSKRIRWSDVINEIEMRTIAVDTHYNQSYYDEIGGIQYNSYEFDASGPTITISGETKRFDTTNFTMIADLIDELNNSDLFENAEMRSFNKSGSIEDGYTATLRLSLDIQQ